MSGTTDQAEPIQLIYQTGEPPYRPQTLRRASAKDATLVGVETNVYGNRVNFGVDLRHTTDRLVAQELREVFEHVLIPQFETEVPRDHIAERIAFGSRAYAAFAGHCEQPGTRGNAELAVKFRHLAKLLTDVRDAVLANGANSPEALLVAAKAAFDEKMKGFMSAQPPSRG